MAPSIIVYSQIGLILVLLALVRVSRADVTEVTKEISLHLVTDENDWPTSPISMYGSIDEIDVVNGEDDSTAAGRRSLFWKRFGYYISYGALSANRIPCPPRSGRSYYTHDCWRARGPVRPYYRGCSAITRCRR